MDLRVKKTRSAIRGAFLELLAQKPLEKISVKELTALAQVSKATFYLHYKDIFDLCECLQQETIANIYGNIIHPEYVISDPVAFTKELFEAFISQQTLTRILFSGNMTSVLPKNIEAELRKHIFMLKPEIENSPEASILLTYQVQGCYYAFMEHSQKFEINEVLDVICKTSDNISTILKNSYINKNYIENK